MEHRIYDSNQKIQKNQENDKASSLKNFNSKNNYSK